MQYPTNNDTGAAWCCRYPSKNSQNNQPMTSPFRYTLATALSVAALAAGCKSTAGAAPGSTSNTNGAATPQSLSFTRLHNSVNSGFASPSELVMQDIDEFTRRWRGVLQGSPDATMPAVDFAKTTIVLVAIGSRNTGGHTVRVDSLISASGGTTVHYTVTSPGSRCMSMQMLTAPVEVISIDRVSGVVRFKKRSVSGGC